jgi:hypothetical protein
MRDVVEHPSTGLTIDFSTAGFGGPEQTAVVNNWRARRAAGRSGRLADPGEFVCHLHRDHHNPFMYPRMDEDTGRVAAVHWPGSGLESHTIIHAPSPQHGRQAEYLGNAAQAAGHQVDMEQYLPTGIKPDLLISGPRAVMSAEVQRSRIGVPTAKRRTTQALLAGATPTWFTDTRANPKVVGARPRGPLQPRDSLGHGATAADGVGGRGAAHRGAELPQMAREPVPPAQPRLQRLAPRPHAPARRVRRRPRRTGPRRRAGPHGVQDLRWPQAGPDRVRRGQGLL